MPECVSAWGLASAPAITVVIPTVIPMAIQGLIITADPRSITGPAIIPGIMDIGTGDTTEVTVAATTAMADITDMVDITAMADTTTKVQGSRRPACGYQTEKKNPAWTFR